VIQADRDAAAYVHAAQYGSATPGYDWILAGECDSEAHVQAFARHRLAFNAPPDGERGNGLRGWRHIVESNPRLMKTARAIADGFTNGNEQFEDASQEQQERYLNAAFATLSPHQGDREAIARIVSAEALAKAMNPGLFDVDHCLAHMAASPLTIEAARRHAVLVAGEMRERLLLSLLQAPPPTDEGVATE
jgi:hypothetical protein